MPFDAQGYWEGNWDRIQIKRRLSEQYHPSNHKYTTHPTYTGKYCCMCGKPLDERALENLNEEDEPDSERAMCTPCRKADEGDEDDEC